MRTKLLATAAILAVGVATSMAQSNVYSLNVVGYVNTPFVANGFSVVANPLNGTNNSLNTIMSGSHVPDGTFVLLWDGATQDFKPDVPTYVAATGNWVPGATINPGTGVFVFAPSAYTNTFVGEVQQGTTTIPIPPNFGLISSPPPIGGPASAVLAQLPATDGDFALRWNPATQDFFPDVPTYVGSSGAWVPDSSFGVGEGIFFFHSGPQTNWVRNFTVAQ